ncbi:type II toxin-antitoxin system VapC family toxin [Wenzhouxiangella sp. XN24]|uniref:PIN domain-containing protein n=1 Tax=Wenzhouxiangella sp. XN24 TaxID=2713569 RepID=UPI0013EC8F25|nr:type II toxin-antitoxin system VapC family toxin [Wenzhouxiangella sp. XN24]
MIVVDTNVIAYLLLPGDRTKAAEALHRRDAEWAAPLLWRSEFRNVLATLIRLGRIELPIAQAIQEQAERLLAPLEFAVDSESVLALAASSGCSAYDCEFVALADYLDVPLVSADRKLKAKFGKRVRPLS